MNLYVDSSALVKRYLAEAGTAEFQVLLANAMQVAVSDVAKVELTATFMRAARGGRISGQVAEEARAALELDWPALVQIHATEPVVGEAVEVAWNYGLRGYDALHLASARYWQNILDEPVTLATFDRELWNACGPAGLLPWPPNIGALLAAP